MANRSYRLKMIAFVVILFTLSLVCCNGKPTDPEVAKGYNVYLNDGFNPNRYYRYNSSTNRVDSLTIPYRSFEGFAVSADGEKLYLTDTARTVVVSTDSLKALAVIPYRGRIVVSPDNQRIAVLGPDIRILSATDYSVVFHDTSSAHRGQFSVEGGKLLCANAFGVVTVDLSNSPIIDKRKSFPYLINKVAPSHDETKWFMLVTYQTCLYSFEVYEPDTDSVVYRDSLFRNGQGDLLTSVDGETVYYTMPGTIMFCGPDLLPPLAVFDVDQNIVRQRLVVPLPVSGASGGQNLAITPDGKKLITDGGPGVGEFAVIDIQTMNILESYYLGNQVDIWDVACQNSN